MSRKKYRNRNRIRRNLPSYRYDDIRAQTGILAQWAQRIVRGDGTILEPFIRNLSAAISAVKKRIRRFRGDTNRYMPHQGKRECLRRRVGGFGYQRTLMRFGEASRDFLHYLSTNRAK